ncbi:MAG: LD-carboxypeptidase [Fimbriimonadia bacterium]
MTKPRHIQPGDRVGIIAPASPVDREQVETGLRLLEDRGYVPVLGEHLWERDGYLAGPDEHRAADIERMFADENIRAVICARGGYGVARALDHLDTSVIAENPKLLVGFSDVTMLHLACQAEADLVTLYAPMLITFSVQRPAWVAEMWFRAMEVPEPLPTLPVEGVASCLTPGTTEGIVLGGCLCLLTDSIGTPYEPDTAESILLLEDVDEQPHRVDAMLQHLKQSGLLGPAEGFVVGEMTRTDEKPDPGIGVRSAESIVTDHLGSRGVPTVTGFPCGHMSAPLTLPLGIRARLDAEAGTLTYLESATS